MGLFLVSRSLNAVERVESRNMFWHLGKRALMAANNRREPKIASLVIYEVLLANTLDRAAIFSRPFLLRHYLTNPKIQILNFTTLDIKLWFV